MAYFPENTQKLEKYYFQSKNPAHIFKNKIFGIQITKELSGFLLKEKYKISQVSTFLLRPSSEKDKITLDFFNGKKVISVRLTLSEEGSNLLFIEKTKKERLETIIEDINQKMSVVLQPYDMEALYDRVKKLKTHDINRTADCIDRIETKKYFYSEVKYYEEQEILAGHKPGTYFIRPLGEYNPEGYPVFIQKEDVNRVYVVTYLEKSKQDSQLLYNGRKELFLLKSGYLVDINLVEYSSIEDFLKQDCFSSPLETTNIKQVFADKNLY